MKRKDSILYRTWSAAVFTAVTFLSVGTSAQTTGSAADDQREVALDEVVVTAQRRETNLQRTALAATVMSGDALKARGVTDLVDVQYVAPSVTISDFGSANVFNIRGIGRSKVDIEIPSGVVIYQDGVPSIAGYFQNEPYFDIESIEVLRGPQGTFVGKSASGGAIFTRTRSPELGELGGNIEGGYGEHDLWELSGALNIPASETLAFRAAFNVTNRDDYYDSIFGPYTGDPGTQDLKSLRLGMLWQPSDKLSVTGKVYVSDLDFGGNVTGNAIDQPPFVIHQDAPFVYHDKSTRATLDIDYVFDNGIKFSSLSGYQSAETQNDLDLNGGIESPRYWFRSQGDIDLLSQEFNLISPDEQRLRWVVGIFLQNQKIELPPVSEFGFTFIGGDPFGIGQLPLDYPWLGSPWIKDEDDRAVFGHITYDLTDSLELEVGARYSDYEFYQVTDYVFGFGDAPPTAPFGSGPGPDRQDQAENSVDWKLALNWDLNDDHFVYGVVSRGHTSGSVNIFPPFDPYDEMEVLNYEAGWKAAFGDRQFLTQLAVYYEDITGYQAAFTDLDIPNSAGQVQGADSDSTIYGVEFTGQATFGNAAIDFGLSFNESELGDFNNVVHPITLATVDLTGAPFPYAPRFTANLGWSYNWELANGSTLVPRIDYGYVQDSQAELFDEPEFFLESRGLLNFRIRWESANGPWYAEAWATNLADKEYVAAIQNLGALYYAGAPRQSGIRVGYDF
jgi:iron complex outermembrane receptor protein